MMHSDCLPNSMVWKEGNNFIGEKLADVSSQIIKVDINSHIDSMSSWCDVMWWDGNSPLYPPFQNHIL